MQRHVWQIRISIVALLLLVVACNATAVETPTEQLPPPEETEEIAEPTVTEMPIGEDEPVTLRVGTLQTLDCINQYACSWWWWYTEGLIYEDLEVYGSDCELLPVIAESIEKSEDGLTWTIRLKDGITYSDGKPLDANAFQDYWNWFTSVDPGGWYPSGLYSVSSEVVDDRTFRFSTEIPVGIFAEYDARFIIPVPAHIWGELDDETLWDFEDFPPVGTGPYVMTEWVPGEHAIYDARPDYWGGERAVDRIILQLYANWDAVINALKSGEIDLTDNAIPVQYYDVLEADPDITTVARPGGYHYALVFNVSETGIKHPAMDDLAVRTAIDYAIDRQQLIEIALEGHGIECPLPWTCSPFAKMADPSLTPTPYDVETAVRLLEEAGYLDSDGDGVREAPDGQPLEFRLYYDSANPSEFTVADLLAGQLSQIGISTVLEGMESGTLWEAVTGARDFDLMIRHMVDEVLPPNVDFYFSCWSAESGVGTFNHPGYCNPAVDDLIVSLIQSKDKAEMEGILAEITQILQDEKPLIMMVGEEVMQAYRHDRFVFPSDYCPGDQGMWAWYSLSKAQVVK